MNPSTWSGAGEDSSVQVLWEDGERIFRRRWLNGADGDGNSVLEVLPAAEHPAPDSLQRLTHEYELKDDLDGAWAVRPLELVREHGRTMLLLADPGGEPLDRLLGRPMDMGQFLRLAISLSAALRQMHERGLIHKDIKPANVLVNAATSQVRLMGFGIASRLPRERQSPKPPESLTGTLAYMAPEQTGRMNRSIDSRSDLYSLGVTLYEMLTGSLPFTASDPMEWVHCHIARQPVPPVDRVTDVPTVVSAIILKLLAKTAEERYQTAAGVEADLRRCLAEWESRRRIDPFTLGAHDTPDRLLIPEKLYGREREIASLLAAFDRVVADGTTELVLVSGYSGIGKSSVVNELHRELVPPRGLFASGKFDQYKRNIPYATLAQAFQSLVRQILGKRDAEMSQWRAALLEALGPNGQLMVNLVPELALIIGEQPPAPNLPPQDQQARFQLVFRRFLGVFARPEHPLVLFLDDLQWLDAATLELIEHLVLHPEVRHLLLVGAYRDNEVSSSHPLTRVLATIHEAGRAQEIVLAPLTPGDVTRMLVDSLHTEHELTRPLADLVFEKTAGNPFFTIQFLLALEEEALLAFDPGPAAWSWDLPRIRAKGFTENVADLMAAKLSRLSHTTQKALGQLACLGNVAETATLTLAHGGAEEAMHAALWEAVRSGLVVRSDSTYTFLHDRIQEVAYALVPEGERAAAHLRIGRLLAPRTAPEMLEEDIFDIVNQFDRGAALITKPEERQQVAALNLLAGRRAKAATAYDSALQYFNAGRALLAESGWDRCYRDTFDLEFNWAECEFLTGEMTAAERRLASLSTHALNSVDLAAINCLQLNLYTTLGEIDRAVEVGLEYLRRIDDTWPLQATTEAVREAYDRLWEPLRSRSIECLLDLPPMGDLELRATMDVLTAFATPAFFTSETLFQLVVCRMAALSLEHGNSDGSPLAYAWLGSIQGMHFGEYSAGLRLAGIGLDLVGRPGLDRFRARVYSVFGVHVANWTQPLETGRNFIRQAFDAAQEAGDLSFAAYCCIDLITNLLAAGGPLIEVEREAEKGLEVVRSLRFNLISKGIGEQLTIIRVLRGLTSSVRPFGNVDLAENRFEQGPGIGSLESFRTENSGDGREPGRDPRHRSARAIGAIRELQACTFMRNFESAIAAVSRTPPLWAVPTQFERAEYQFYEALARSALCDTTSGEERRRHFDALVAHHRQILIWAESCPATFANRAALVGAEIARLEGREMDAMRLYEEAVRTAREHGFVQNEGLSNEFAARFYAARGFETIANAYLRNARSCYLRWGADGKVRQLDRLHPHLAAAEGHRPTATTGSPIQQLDVASIVKAFQTVSSEIELPKLIERLMTIALENAGADRGLLILPAGEDHLIQAEAQATGDQVEVMLCQKAITGISCPESLVRYVIRTHESVILDDASRPNLFSEDDYLRGRRPKSVLCLPLLKQGQLTGLLYLENTLTSHAFAPDRIAVLELLAAQAAISLENTRLYSDLQEREAKVRRLVDSNIIGIYIWDFDGRIIEANEAFLHMMGHSRDDLISGLVHWSALTPNEWSDVDERALAELRATASCKAYEKEYFRKDGSRVPVLVGAATFGERRHQGVAFVLDLTERNRAEGEIRESERRYSEVHMELAHANRVATMGQLSASIAHELNQPIAAAVINADVALRLLSAEPPDLEEVRDALGCIVKDCIRASDVIKRMHALIKKAPTRTDHLEINEAIVEVISLIHGEVVKNGVSVRTQLAEGLPLTRGDRVQLQQVVLNLIINAIEAMSGVSEGSRELLISTGESNGVLVAIRDSGPRLTPASLERFFDAFYTTKPSGLGMGLSICRTIIEAHGGRLWATANVPQGAILQFRLPAYSGSAP